MQPEKAEKTFFIGTLTVKFGEAEYVDYSKGDAKPEKQLVSLNRERTYHDVSGLQELMKDIMLDVVANEGVRELTKWAKDNKDTLGVKEEEIEEASKIIGGFLNSLQGK